MTRRWAEAPLDGKIERKKENKANPRYSPTHTERKKENKANPRYSPSHTPTYLNAGAVITAFLMNHLKCLEREIRPSYGGD
jgi:hypothetical protein